MYMHTERHFTNIKQAIILVLLLIVVAGCSNGEQAAENGSNTNNGAAESTPSSSPAASSEMRTLEGLQGTVEIPAQPQRIAGLSYAYADHLLALGMKPYAMVTQIGTDMPAYLKDRLEDVIPLGLVQEFNKEALLEAEPDLILANQATLENYDTLKAIAPVYMTGYFKNSLDWFKDTAKAVGKEQEADEIVEALYQKAEDLGDKIAASSKADDTILIFRLSGKQIQIFAPSETDPDAFYSPNLLYDIAGLQAPDFAQAGIHMKEVLENVSLELLPQLNPDHIFLILSGSEADNKDALDNMRNNAVWKGLTAVQQDQVYLVNNTVWIAGFGPIAYSQVLDEVEAALLGE